MLLFLLAVFLYAISLVLCKPSPDSLKEKPSTLTQHFWSIKASFFTGILLLVIFFMTSNFNFMMIDEALYTRLALHNSNTSIISFPLQLFSHSFIHFGNVHLVSNVTGIGIASAYERRVGYKRFLRILVIGCLFATPSVFFYSEPHTACGISGGVYGLGAAYFLDHEILKFKEWGYSLIAFICLMAALSISTEFADKKMLHYKIDHIGHVLGAFGVIAYCYFYPKVSKKSGSPGLCRIC